MKKRFLTPFACLTAVTLAPVALSAQSIAIPNASFEARSGYWAADDWDNAFVAGPTGSNHIVEIKTEDRAGKDGNNFLFLNLENGNPGEPTSYGYVYSAGLGTYQANLTYALTVSIAKGSSFSMPETRAGLGFRADNIDQNLTWYDANSVAYDFEKQTILLSTLEYPELIGQEIGIVLAVSHAGDYGRGMAFDDVHLDVIPEPATIGVIFGLTTLAIVMIRRRRRT